MDFDEWNEYDPIKLSPLCLGHAQQAQESFVLVSGEMYIHSLIPDIANKFWEELEKKILSNPKFECLVLTGRHVFRPPGETYELFKLFRKSRSSFDQYKNFNYFITKRGQPEVHGVIIDDQDLYVEAFHPNVDSRRFIGHKRGREFAQAFRYATVDRPIIENKTIHLMREDKLEFYTSLEEWRSYIDIVTLPTDYEESSYDPKEWLLRRMETYLKEYTSGRE
jgi:hypothetical protein